jgi:4-hydroxybenzoate polyprenyltransferase
VTRTDAVTEAVTQRPHAQVHPVVGFARLVKLSHTVFGLPFAFASGLVAHRVATAAGAEGLTWTRVLLVLVAFTGARAAAMGFNRIVDRDIDADNPRTADREIPTGVVSLRSAWLLTLVAAAAFVGAAVALGPWPARLALPCLVLVGSYSYFKRFSWGSHLILGVSLSLAPGGAWIAITGGFAGWMVPVSLMGAVATWVAGFDVLYSLADEDFDRRRGLHSIPARFGRVGALWISGGLHVATVACLLAFHALAGLGAFHLAGVLLIAGILSWEHWIVRPNDLSRLGKAFFDLNGYVSLAYLAMVAADVALLGGV